MSQRYYLEQPPVDDRATLTTTEAHHLAHVMRGKVGEQVTLFDGVGHEFQARIERIGKHDVTLAVLSQASVDRELAVPITLGVALPRGDRQAWLVEKLVELGVTSLVPLETARGVAQPTDKALERLRRGVIEASKQCGRTRLMQVVDAQTWRDFVSQGDVNAARLVAHPYAPAVETTFWTAPPSAGFLFAVGPEGGLTDDEVESAREQGWQVGALGERILRIETAAMVLAVWASRG
ncbi:MAG: 16S rRNA (uracil(1498)-N(3))-methyltransferase [Planctomycetaceae bacterium]|nr:16S rRNA (uracil(1498)-N(3))-methyltransferase [Planctomycetaceae bacterium]